MKANKNSKIFACFLCTGVSVNFCMFCPMAIVLIASLSSTLATSLILQFCNHDPFVPKQILIKVLKKITNLFIVAIGFGLDWIITIQNINILNDDGTNSIFAVCTMVWIILNEWVNILDNVKNILGEDKTPSFIVYALELIKDNFDDKIKTTTFFDDNFKKDEEDNEEEKNE